MDGVIILPQSLNISNLNKILDETRNAITSQDKIILDAKDVEEVDALGLQLVLGIEKTAQINNIEFKIINLNAELARLFTVDKDK